MKETDIYFDDIEISQLNLVFLTNHEHPLAPGTRDKIITIPNRHGAIDYGADLEPISLSLPFAIIRNNRMEIQQTVRKVKSFLIDKHGNPRTFKLTFGYEPDKYYNVRYSGSIPIERLMTVGQFVLPLICYDGHAWSSTTAEEVVWGSEEIYFSNDSYTLGHGGSGAKHFIEPGQTTITVTGANIKPVLSVEGTGEDVSISWLDKTLSLGTFSNASWVLDLANYEIEKDGLNALHLIDGDWLDMELELGDNQITIEGNNLDLSFKANFRDCYF